MSQFLLSRLKNSSAAGIYHEKNEASGKSVNCSSLAQLQRVKSPQGSSGFARTGPVRLLSGQTVSKLNIIKVLPVKPQAGGILPFL